MYRPLLLRFIGLSARSSRESPGMPDADISCGTVERVKGRNGSEFAARYRTAGLIP